MTRRQLEEMRARIDKQLQSCAICNTEGATVYRITASQKSDRSAVASLMLCRPCFERHRLPEGRAT